MADAQTISRTQSGLPARLDFRRLRDLGLEHIQQLGGGIWTDHNAHDPGITMLEVLCYALLDLGYRTAHPMADLLASSTGGAGKTVFTPAEALGSAPMTANDYRKLLLDIPGVRNAWLDIAEKSETDLFIDCRSDGHQLHFSPNEASKKLFLNGLFRVTLELDRVRPQDAEQKNCGTTSLDNGRILAEAERLLQANRNLCEDFLSIDVLQDEQIAFCARIEIDPAADAETALVEMFARLDRWLSPEPRFYTLQQMLEKGKTMEEIFEGRPLGTGQHGFVDLDEHDALRPGRDEIHASDLIRVLLDAPDGAIRAVHELTMMSFIGGAPQTSGADWCLHLRRGYRPVIEPSLARLTLLKNGQPFQIDLERVQNRFRNRLSNAQKRSLRPYELDQLPPVGTRRAIGEYWSIQHDFPAIFGVGPGTIPAETSPVRKAQALQLKGFLLFFDQLLASYLGQLGQLASAFSLLPPDETGQPPSLLGSVDLASVPDLEQLVRGGTSDPDGDLIAGEKFKFRRGEVVFFPKAEHLQFASEKPQFGDFLFFKSPEQRARAILRLQKLAEKGDFHVKIIENDCRKNLILLPTDIKGDRENMVLQSAQAYPAEDFDRLPHEAQGLSFLFLSAENYRLIDLQKEGKYTFEVMYDPLPLAQTLRKSADRPAVALAQRNRFLDHLLARFGEDFSDYALVQFAAAGGKQPPLENLLHDKSHFLADWPLISQRRATGFDQTAAPVWDVENVSGLERRAARLMGLERIERRTLAPFSVEKREKPGLLARLRDHRGRAIFENCQPVAAGGEADFLKNLKAQAAEIQNYRRLDCCDFARFGFELLDAGGCPLAAHPDFYASPAERDAKMGYLAAAFSGPNCLATRFFERPAGWFFGLEKDGATLARSPEPFADRDSAVLAWLEFAEIGRDFSAFRVENDPLGNGFLLKIQDATGRVVAVAPHFFEDEEAAKAAAQAIQKCLAENDPAASLAQRPAAQTWQFRSPENGLPLLVGRWPFSAREQSAFALADALEQAAERTNFCIETADAGYSVFLKNAADLPLADLADGPFSTIEAAEKAIGNVQKWAAPEAAFFRKIGVSNAAARLGWAAETGETWLVGTRIFENDEAAKGQFSSLLSAAAEPGNWLAEATDDGLELRLFDGTGRFLAAAPAFFESKTEADEQRDFLIAEARKKHGLAIGEKVGSAYFFRLTDGDGEPILQSAELFLDKKAARAALVEAHFFARQPAFLQPFGGAEKDDFGIQLLDEKGQILAVSMQKMADSAARDAFLNAWRAWLARPENGFWLHETAGHWQFRIEPSGQAAMVGAGLFSTKNAALLALEKALSRAVEPAALGCSKEAGACLFSIVLADENGDRLAESADFFESKTACETAAAGLSGWLAAHPSPCRTALEPSRWHVETRWENCFDRLETAFSSATAGWETEAAARAAFDFLIQNAAAAATANDFFEVEIRSDGWWGVRLKNEKTGLWHPQLYGSEAAAKCAFSSLFELLRGGVCAKTESQTERGAFFKIKKDAASVAFRTQFFKTAAERDAVLEAEKKAAGCCGPLFSTLHRGACRVEKRGLRWVFVLREGHDCGCIDSKKAAPPVLWESATTFADRAEAEAAFDAQFLEILVAAADFSNYEPCCDGTSPCFYRLKNPCKGGEFLAQTPAILGVAEDEAKKRVGHARLFPIAKTADGCFGFQLFDAKKQRVGWLSRLVFPSFEEAETAFEAFLRRLEQAENWSPTDRAEKFEFGFEVCEIGLCETGAATVANEPGPGKRLENCLARFGDEVRLEAFLDEKRGCGFGLRLVETSFRLARHPRVFHDFEQRERARAELFGQIRCEISCHEVEILKMRTKTDCFECNSGGWLFEKWQIGFGLLASPTDDPCAVCTGANELDAGRVVDLLALARAEDCWAELPSAGSSKKEPGETSWGLFDAAGELVGRSVFSSKSESERLDWRSAAIRSAWEYPIVRRNAGFSFQLAAGPEKVLFEGLETYATVAEAWSAFCKLLILVKEKRHFEASEASDAGPFGIDLVDPSAIKARQPMVWPSRSAAQKAAKRLGDCLDSEGLHLVEHLLLRPRGADLGLFQVECTGCDELEKAEKWDAKRPELGILTGADPFSFWATVVLPYWSRRFRNLRFREFFEQTLRREAPAHVRLRIAWLAPEQMLDFEKKWRDWLEVNTQNDSSSCGWAERQKALVAILDALQNAYPDGSVLGDFVARGAAESNVLVLGQSLLT